jgi:hypothetical protein
MPRKSIQLPNGCAFVAHSGQYKTLADIYAETLLALDKALKTSWLGKECDVDQFRDLKYVTAGVPMNDWFEFIPVGDGRFLIKLVCSIGAYNWWTLVFAYDESHIPREKVGVTAPHSLPALIIFPIFHAHYAPSNFIYAINMRDLDRKYLTLFHYDKMLGDGSGGIYAEYRIDRRTFIPALRRSMHKDFADHEETYDFERGKLPRGKDWLVDDVRSVPSGCLMTLESHRLPATEPIVSCHGQRAMVR